MTPAIDNRMPALAEAVLQLPLIEPDIRHTFAPGVYVREMRVPAGSIVIGHVHKHDCMNIVLQGRATVLVGDELKEIAAPMTFVSKAGARKAAMVYEDLIWLNVHPTTETDLAKIEEHFIEKDALALEIERELTCKLEERKCLGLL